MLSLANRSQLFVPMTLLISAAAHASVVASSANIPPSVGSYDGPGWSYNVGPAGFFNVAIDNFSAGFLPPQNVGNTAVHSFGASVTGDFIVFPNPPTHTVASANATYFISKVGGPNGSSLGLYNTEMLQLDITGLPGGALIRESPTLASTGQTTISDAGGGLFLIDSFFDVFTELSVDGGQTWAPSSTSSHQVLQVVPEPGSVLLLAAGLLAIGRLRKRL